jgi:hypothetical protein
MATNVPAGSGSIDLDLELPPTGDLRPANMTTVAVSVTTSAGVENVTTTPLDGMSFSAGEVSVGDPVLIGVELHDQTDRLVGFGRNLTPITPDTDAQTVKIDVRKPFVYIASTGPVSTIDTTVDVLDPKYQGALSTAGTLAIPIDGTEMAVINGSTLQRVTTSDHKPTGTSIDLRATVIDAASVPGKRQIVAATATNLVVVDIDAGMNTTIPLTTKPDRIAVGGDADGGFTVYVLSGRVAAPQGMTATCTGTSSVIAVPLAGGASTPVGGSVPLADIAASGDAVYGANPCAGSVGRLDGGSPKIQLSLSGASSVAVEGVRLWAAGSSPSATDGAQIILSSVQLDGTDPQTVKLTPKTEIMTYDGDPDGEFAIDLHADTEVALDLTVLPGAQTVALIARMDSTRPPRVADDGFGGTQIVIPAMVAVVHDIVLADTKTGAVRRIRSKCALTLSMTSQAEFPAWSCAAVSADETPAGGPMIPASVSALYGGR